MRIPIFRIRLRGIVLITLFAFVQYGCTPKVARTGAIDLVPGNPPPKSEIKNSVKLEKVAIPQKSTEIPVKKIDRSLPVDHTVRMGELSNGMKYYIKKNTHPENRVALRLAVSVGSINEDEGQEGMAHFIEHMCFNGTKSFAKDSLVKYLESVGTKFGPDLNAYTSFDETVYMLEVRGDDAEQFDNGLLILKEWAGDVTMDDEEIDKERGVVISEWRTRLSPRQRMSQKYFPVMYHNSKYAQRLPIGKVDVIQNGSYETFKRYYNDWYRPDLMAIVVVGDIDVDKVEEQVKTLFSQLENPDNPRVDVLEKVPPHEETLVSISTDKEATFSTVMIVNKFEHIPVLTKDDYIEWMKRELYNDMVSARLTEMTQQKDPPFLFAFSGYGSDVGNIDMYRSFASVKQGQWLKGIEVLLEENQRVKQHGFTHSEFERAKARMIQNAKKAVKEKDKMASGRLAMSYVYNFLKKSPIPSPAQKLAMIETYLIKLNLADINALAKEWGENKNRVVVLTGPKPKDGVVPGKSDVLKLIHKVEDMKLEAYSDKVTQGEWLQSDLVPSAIESDQPAEGLEQVHEVTLNNGVKLILMPTDFKNDEILLSAWSKGGHSLYNDEMFKQARFTSGISNMSGVAGYSKTDMDKMFAGKDLRLNSFISTYEEGLRGKSSVKDLEWFLQWVHYNFSAAGIDSSAFSSFVSRNAAIYSNLLSDPRYYYQNEVSKVKYDGHPRTLFPDAASIQALDQNTVDKIYKERFADVSDFTFCFVGNFDLNEMKNLCAKYLGSLPAKNIKEIGKDVHADIVPGSIVKRWKKGEASKSYVAATFHGKVENADAESHAFQTMVKLLSIKLREKLREDMGGVYGVRVNGNISRFPKPEYEINISFNADPPMVDDLVQAVKKEIVKIKNYGTTQAELDKVFELQRQSKIKNLKENNYWLSKLKFYYSNDLDPAQIRLEALESQIDQLKLDQISEIAKRYLNKDNSLWLIQDPE